MSATLATLALLVLGFGMAAAALAHAVRLRLPFTGDIETFTDEMVVVLGGAGGAAMIFLAGVVVGST